jgi:hypothetical protein
MLNLKAFNNDGLELIVNTETGECFASIRALARMIDKSSSTVNDYVNGGFKTARKMDLKTAEIITPTGLKTARLLNENQILEVVSKYNPTLLIKFAQCGLRVFLHALAGYSIKSEAVDPVEPNSQQHRQLPPIRDTIDWLNASDRIAQLTDPILKSYLTQSLYEDLGAKAALPSADIRLAPIAVLAREKGYTLKPGQDSQLGKFAKKHLEPKGTAPHGRYEVNIFEDSEQTNSIIEAFFHEG